MLPAAGLIDSPQVLQMEGWSDVKGGLKDLRSDAAEPLEKCSVTVEDEATGRGVCEAHLAGQEGENLQGSSFDFCFGVGGLSGLHSHGAIANGFERNEFFAGAQSKNHRGLGWASVTDVKT